MLENSILTFLYALDGLGGAQAISIEQYQANPQAYPLIWLHCDHHQQDSHKWLIDNLQLDEITAEALCMRETRPRSLIHANGLFLILRGVNYNLGADPADMLSLRIWITKNLIVTTSHRHIAAIHQIEKHLLTQDGPKDAGDFLISVCDELTNHLADIVCQLDDQADEFEDTMSNQKISAIRSELSTVRRRIILLRRYLIPQRDALSRLQTDKISWLNDLDKMHLREILDSLIRNIEDLDATKDRATVIQEELINRITEQLNQRMYLLSIITVIFMPISYVAGLLGINVAGIPGAQHEQAFYAVILISLGIVTLTLILLRLSKWL